MRFLVTLLAAVMSIVYFGWTRRLNLDKVRSILDNSGTQHEWQQRQAQDQEKDQERRSKRVQAATDGSGQGEVEGMTKPLQATTHEAGEGEREVEEGTMLPVRGTDVAAASEEVQEEVEAMAMAPLLATTSGAGHGEGDLTTASPVQAAFDFVGYGSCEHRSGGFARAYDHFYDLSLPDCKSKCAAVERCRAIETTESLAWCFLFDTPFLETNILSTPPLKKCYNMQAATNAEGQGEREGTTVKPAQASEYVTANAKNNMCPEGSHAIADASSCRAVADALGLTYVIMGSFPDSPHGCYSGSVYMMLGRVVYNTAAGRGIDDRRYELICKKDEAKPDKTNRVRVVKDVIGKARDRWAKEGEHSLLLFQEDLGTINSVSVTGQIGVIFNQDLKKEVFVKQSDLVEDDPPVKEAGKDADTLIQDVLKNFPRAADMVLLRCPLTKQVFRFPVVASDGRTYEKDDLEVASNGLELAFPNHAINSVLKDLASKVEDQLEESWGEASEDMKYQILAESPPALGPGYIDTFRCPISKDFFRDPVVASDGHTYERRFIKEVLQHSNPISPMDRTKLSSDPAKLFPNRVMKALLSALIDQADLMQKADHIQEANRKDSTGDHVVEDKGFSDNGSVKES